MTVQLNRRKITYLPLERATKEPGDGAWDVWSNRWWCHEPGKGLMFYNKSPQCNPNERLARSVMEKCHPGAELIFVERVYLPHNCNDYI